MTMELYVHIYIYIYRTRFHFVSSIWPRGISSTLILFSPPANSMVDSIWTRSLECHHVCQLMLHHGQHSSRSAVVPRFITPFLQPPQEISEVLVIAIGTQFDVHVIEAHSGRILPAQLPSDVIHVCFANRIDEQLLTFSPDGGRLAVACNSGLYIVRSDDQSMTVHQSATRRRVHDSLIRFDEQHDLSPVTDSHHLLTECRSL